MGKEKKRLPVGVENFEQIIKDVAGGMQFLLNSEVLSDYDKSDYKALLDSSLKFAVLTGCMRISKESIFTGLNNFTTFTIADVDFDKYFGFTDWEVRELLTYYDCNDKCGNLDAACERALKQAEERKYDEELRENGVNEILKYGIACYMKRCKVKVQREVENYVHKR